MFYRITSCLRNFMVLETQFKQPILKPFTKKDLMQQVRWILGMKMMFGNNRSNIELKIVHTLHSIFIPSAPVDRCKL